MNRPAVVAQSLLRVAVRSLYGLVSFLGTRYPGLDLHASIRCLLSDDADLRAAEAEAERQGHQCPQPDAQAQRLSSCSRTTLGPAMASLLQDQNQDGRQLSSQDRHLAALLSPNSGEPAPPQQQPAPPVTEDKIHAKVKAALSRYALQSGQDDVKYEVQMMCGVNERVSGPVLRMDMESYDHAGCCLPYIHHHTHVNFLASASASASAGATPPALFFAEFSNDHDGAGADELCWCCPVSAPPPCAGRLPRCMYCDYEASRIVHPAVEAFHGRELEFEKMVSGEELFDEDYTNYDIIQNNEFIAEWVEEGCFYDESCGCEDD